MYKSLIRPILFKFDPEKVHHFSFKSIKFMFKLPLMKSIFKGLYSVDDSRLERDVFGLKFKNPVGIAAGFDKDAHIIDELSCMGFGFIEIGTLTPVGQPGNTKPRLFRVPQDQAVINRMGFNNEGVETAIKRLKARKTDVLVGGNIGKNKVTPNEQAYNDYEKCFHALYEYVDYFVVNVSSPNTPGLRALQDKEPLTKLLVGLKELNEQKPKQKPILLKIAPNLDEGQLDDIVEVIKNSEIDGLIATNTTISTDDLTISKAEIDALRTKDEYKMLGGVSGKVLTNHSTQIIRYLANRLDVPIIGVGGIMTAEDALEKLEAGASLVQIYSGFIYEGPNLVKRINKAILAKM
ncbi:MAG: quinone-dependent dihydroorotate dehydrogenase [Cytophagales bacterium]|nr:quinone-dependent dihydroorotate dehydrogenase [Cytophagales bacterium]